MARVLIVGCGCRGRVLADELLAAGRAVRGTTRRESGTAAIAEAGIEPALADPDRLATLMPAIEGASVVCWLMGKVESEPLHGPRLRSFLELLVDTPVRGLVYETGGADRPAAEAAVQHARATWRMPVEVVRDDSTDLYSWSGAMAAAVARVLEA